MVNNDVVGAVPSKPQRYRYGAGRACATRSSVEESRREANVKINAATGRPTLDLATVDWDRIIRSSAAVPTQAGGSEVDPIGRTTGTDFLVGNAAAPIS